MHVTELQTRRAAAQARNYAYGHAHGLMTEGRNAADHIARALLSLKDVASDADVAELRAVALDLFGNLNGKIEKIMDDEGMHADDMMIDLSEIRA